LGQYQFMQLTAAELGDVLAFVFPAVRPETLSVNYASVTMHCLCGEDTPNTTVGLPIDDVYCICGRVWHLETTHQLLDGQVDPHPPMR
jgi:hypothetical protein